MINARIVADSINENGIRIISFILTYPRFIHSELMTHRAFSRNAASSRAIPIKKIMDEIVENPATPIHWGKLQKGMQAEIELDQDEKDVAELRWLQAASDAADQARQLEGSGLHKQIVNRVLEPYMHMNTLLTATDRENFYSLRAHKDAQPELQALAYEMIREEIASEPRLIMNGGWHIPFGDKMPDGIDNATRMKIATARAARVSYKTFDGKINVEKDIELHDQLARDGHWSPFEHAAQAQGFDDRYFGNLRGWKPYRKFFPQENRKVNILELWEKRPDSIGSHKLR